MHQKYGCGIEKSLSRRFEFFKKLQEKNPPGHKIRVYMRFPAEKTQDLLRKTMEQTEEMRAQEEEMR